MHDIIKERYSPVCRSLLVELMKIKIFVMFEYANYRLIAGEFDVASTLNSLSFQYSKDNDLPVQQYCVEQRWTIRKALAMEREKETSMYMITSLKFLKRGLLVSLSFSNLVLNLTFMKNEDAN